MDMMLHHTLNALEATQEPVEIKAETPESVAPETAEKPKETKTRAVPNRGRTGTTRKTK